MCSVWAQAKLSLSQGTQIHLQIMKTYISCTPLMKFGDVICDSKVFVALSHTSFCQVVALRHTSFYF